MKKPNFCWMILFFSGLAFFSETQAQGNLPVATGNDEAADAVQAREVVKRQEAVFRAQNILQEGLNAEKEGDWIKAQERFRSVITILGKNESESTVMQGAGRGLARVNYQLARQALARQQFAEAQKLLEEAQQWEPKNKQVAELLEKVKKAGKDPKVAGALANPAMTPNFQAQVEKVEDLFVLAEQYRRTGQYDEATATLKKILVIDPYNEAAQNQLEKIIKEKMSYANVAREQTREKRLLEVERNWANLPKRPKKEEVSTTANVAMTRSKKYEMIQKMKTLIIPSLDFRGATVSDAVQFLVAKSREVDPEKQGVQMVVKEEVRRQESSKPFSLSLKNVPLGEALRYVARLCEVKYKIDEYAIVIVPLAESVDSLVSRIFNVSPTFINVASSPAAEGESPTAGRRLPGKAEAENKGNDTVVAQLQERGVDFSAPGSAAIYSPTQGTLTILNTQDQIDLIEELVNAEGGQTLLVDVAVKFIEIAQDDLNELTFNTDFNLLSTQFGGTPRWSTRLRGSQGVTSNGIDSLLKQGISNATGPVMTEVSSLTFKGFLIRGSEFNAVVTALAQKKSTDLLSSPSVRVKQGTKATLVNVRRFLYPTAFTEPKAIEPVTTDNTTDPAAAAVVPAFPNAFEARDIGVKLDIQPQIPSDKQTIELAMQPEVSDFEGFINYGSEIKVSAGTTATTATLSDNIINQPVFNTRKVATKVFLKDNFTTVLGGLMREDIQKVEDKVPFIGDIPFIGRFFKSEAMKSTKKNLLIFVTARILLPDGTPLHPD